MKNQSYYRLFIGVTTVPDVLLLIVLFKVAVAQLPETAKEGNSLLLTIVLCWLVLLNVFEMNQPDRHRNAGMIVQNLSMLYLPFLAFMVICAQVVLKLEAYTLAVLITITLFISVALSAPMLLKNLCNRLHQSNAFKKMW